MNKGAEFKVPDMTVKAHEQAMDDMIRYGKMKEEKYNRLFNKQLMLVQLKKIDDKVTLEDIAGLHPDDYLDLFQKIWTEGKRKSDKKFRK